MTLRSGFVVPGCACGWVGKTNGHATRKQAVAEYNAHKISTTTTEPMMTSNAERVASEEEDSRLCPECRQTIERFSETGWVSDEHSDYCHRHPDNAS